MKAPVVLAGCAVTVAVVFPASTVHAQAPGTHCALSVAGGFDTATPESVALDPTAVHDAIAYASAHLRTSVKIFRNNCLVAAGPFDATIDGVRMPLWSSTKSVVSILTGIAAGQNELDVDDPIDRYLPTGPAWGDPAHRSITIRHLLTQTSGLDEAILAEVITTGTDPHIARQALAQPLIHEPGTRFAYGQRTPDLLAFVLAQAVGEDLQDYAQRMLFDPLGIDRSAYTWLRDRSGNTYGYAHLFMPPTHYAKLGLLMQNNGNWNGHQVVPADYVRQVGEPTPTNGCYGLLFWTNRGTSCTGGNMPVMPAIEHRMIPSAPADLYAIVGAFHQNNFIIPSLNMTVTWTGVAGDTNPLGCTNHAASDLYHEFFRILMRGVRDHHIPDPGPYQPPTTEPDFNPFNYADPEVLLRDLAPNPDCTVIACPAPGS
ncbi:serine hydrolase domain-containing protein [Nocardia sp. NPDC003979]